MIKGNVTCAMCKNKFWDEIELPEGYRLGTSFCKECGNKLGLATLAKESGFQ